MVSTLLKDPQAEVVLLLRSEHHSLRASVVTNTVISLLPPSKLCHISGDGYCVPINAAFKMLPHGKGLIMFNICGMRIRSGATS